MAKDHLNCAGPGVCNHCSAVSQGQENEKLNRSALCLTLAQGQGFEMSNGVSVEYRSQKGRYGKLVVLVPRETRIYRRDPPEVDEDFAKPRKSIKLQTGEKAGESSGT